MIYDMTLYDMIDIWYGIYLTAIGFDTRWQ
jgi:hypothetical protein